MAQCADNGDIVLLLLAQLDPCSAAGLPNPALSLPEVGRRLVHIPDGLAYANPL